MPGNLAYLPTAERLPSGIRSSQQLKFASIPQPDVNNNLHVEKPTRASTQPEGEKVKTPKATGTTDNKPAQSNVKKKPSLNVKPGFIIRNRWEIIKRLGSGGFGEVYLVYDKKRSETLAVKMEPVSQVKQVLKMEVAVLKKLQDQSLHVCKYIDCGRNATCNYMVMSLLGSSLADLRRAKKQNCFTLSTSLRITRQMLLAIRDMHNAGYLHRDVKPSNFAIGVDDPRKIYMFDFGLARVYLIDGKVREPRSVAGFRGTVRYASLTAHRSKEMGRCDDLWSLFYIMLEFMGLQLPWKRTKIREDVGQIKEDVDHYELLRTCEKNYKLPHKSIDPYVDHLSTLSYHSTPDYDKLDQIFLQALAKIKVNVDDPYDWELNPPASKIPKTIPQVEDRKKIANVTKPELPHSRTNTNKTKPPWSKGRIPTDQGEREKTRGDCSEKTLPDEVGNDFDIEPFQQDFPSAKNNLLNITLKKTAKNSNRLSNNSSPYSRQDNNKSPNYTGDREAISDKELNIGNVQLITKKIEQWTLKNGGRNNLTQTRILPGSNSTGNLNKLTDRSHKFSDNTSGPNSAGSRENILLTPSGGKTTNSLKPTPPRNARTTGSKIASRVRRFNQQQSSNGASSNSTLEKHK